MKTILFLSALFLASYFEATVAKEDYDIRFEKFLKDSLADFPNYLIETGRNSYHYDRDGNFTLHSEDTLFGPIYDFTVKVWDRVYHGAEHGIEFFEIEANLSGSHFDFVMAHGDAEKSFVEGQYSIDGTITGVPMRGEGKFVRTNLPRKIHNEAHCTLNVTDEGYFEMEGCYSYLGATPFQNFTLYGLDEVAAEVNIGPAVEGWYNSQYGTWEGPDIFSPWHRYMRGVFAATPIADIVGDKFALTVTSAKGLRKIPKYSQKTFFDKEKKEMREEIFISA